MVMPNEEIEEYFDFPKMHKHQKIFATTRARCPLSLGGMGSGKSLALIIRAIFLSSDTPYFGNLEGNYGVIGRFRRTDLEDTTMDDFFEFFPDKWIKHFDKKRFLLTMMNESRIQFVPLEDFRKFRSRNLGWAAFEQIEETPEKVFEEIDAHRLRRTKTLTGNHVEFHSVFGVANPCENWVFDLWGVNEEKLESKDQRERDSFDPNYPTIHSSVYDNKANLPPDYIPNMEKKYGGRNSKKGKMYMLGLWGSAAGYVYNWNDDFINEVDEWPPLEWKTIVGFDDGWGFNGVVSMSFIALEPLEYGRTRFHCYDELYLVDPDVESTAEVIDNTLQFHAIKRAEKSKVNPPEYITISMVPCDPSMKAAGQKIRKEGDKQSRIRIYNEMLMERRVKFPFVPSNNNISIGTDRVGFLLNNGLLRFNPRCVHHRKSLKGYVWDEDNPSEPKKHQDDHPCDDIRYAIMKVGQKYLIPREDQKETVLERITRKRNSHITKELGVLI